MLTDDILYHRGMFLSISTVPFPPLYVHACSVKGKHSCAPQVINNSVLFWCVYVCMHALLWPKLAFSFWSSCLHVLRTGIILVNVYNQLTLLRFHYTHCLKLLWGSPRHFIQNTELDSNVNSLIALCALFTFILRMQNQWQDLSVPRSC